MQAPVLLVSTVLLAIGCAPPPTSGNINGLTVSCADDLDNQCELALNVTMESLRGKPVQRGLTARDFSLSDLAISNADQWPYPAELSIASSQVTAVDPEVLDAAGLSVTILLDRSGSMEEEDRAQSISGARTLIASLSDDPNLAVEYAVLSFPASYGVTSLGDASVWTDFSNDLDVVEDALDALDADDEAGGTPLYDALMEAIDHAEAEAAPDHKRLIVVLTDGYDGDSWSDATEVIEAAVQTGTAIYPVGLGDSLDSYDLGLLASDTGGLYLHSPSNSELQKAFSTIAKAVYGSVQVRIEVTFEPDSTVSSGNWSITGWLNTRFDVTMELDEDLYVTL